MKESHNSLNKPLTGAALVLAANAAVYAQPFAAPGTGWPPPPPPPPKPAAGTPVAPAAPAPEPGSVTKFLQNSLPDAIAQGKFNLNVRLRYELVDQEGVVAITEDSHAPTIRTRFGYTSAPLYGFQGMVEGENIASLGPEHNYNAAGSNNQGDKPVVADPTTTELNQAWLSYSYTNLFSIKGGRQRLVLDNHRFVGDVGWRQNMQTFDAVTLEGKPLANLSLLYSYVWDVNRVFGDVSGLPAANTDFDSNSHFLNAAYSGWKYGKFAGYSYLLDLENGAGSANSAATYGGYFAGTTAVHEKISLAYRAEFAWQTDYGDSLLDYEAEYFNVEVGANIKPFAFGGGYEVLGTDTNEGPAGGSASFRTPLATLHAFNGWADVFLVTPPNGLRDAYGYAQVTLPWQMPLRFVYHKFDADSGSGDYGHEYDVVLSKSFGKNWSAMLKYAFYDGKDAPAAFDVQKFWAQVEFNF
jgi:hypothetical protein